MLRISMEEPLASHRDVSEATVDFETFMVNYHRFVTLRKITNYIDDKLNKRMKKVTKINLHHQEIEDSQEVRMGSARIKDNPSIVQPHNVTDSDEDERSDPLESKSSSRFSRDPDFILEDDYDYWKELSLINEEDNQ